MSAPRICATPKCGCQIINMNPRVTLCSLCIFERDVLAGKRCRDCGERTLATVKCACQPVSEPRPTFSMIRYQEEGR